MVDGLDSDGDGDVSSAEALVREAEIAAYVGAHYRLIVGANESLDGGRALAVVRSSVRWLEPDERVALGPLESAVEVELLVRDVAPIEDLVLEVTLFHDTSPDHIDLARVRWGDGGEDGFGVMAETPRVRAGRSDRGAFAAFLRLGVRHILSGWDHLAFVALLVLGAAGSWRRVLGWLTAFTVAHSVTLGLMATGVVSLGGSGGLVEMLIALSVAYVGVANVVGWRDGAPPRGRWWEVAAFGGLHGFGFAGFLSRSLVGEGAKGFALFGFNVGVELGQVAVVVLLFALLGWWSPAATRRLRVGGSLGIAAMGLWWFGERAGLL